MLRSLQLFCSKHTVRNISSEFLMFTASIAPTNPPSLSWDHSYVESTPRRLKYADCTDYSTDQSINVHNTQESIDKGKSQ